MLPSVNDFAVALGGAEPRVVVIILITTAVTALFARTGTTRGALSIVSFRASPAAKNRLVLSKVVRLDASGESSYPAPLGGTMNAELCYRTLTEVAGLLQRREISPVELTRAVLARIERLEPQLHSYITVVPERALDRARAAERELATGVDRGPLHGVPIAVKDLFFTKGVPTTCASRVLAGWVPEFDATAVGRLEAAGAVLLGKLNMTEFAMSGYAPSLPIPRNPWDPGRHTGGSSSGPGVATAAGLCFASLGSDTGGSIRNPSAWCGVVGLKPTYGRVSHHGVFPLGMTLDHVGPITRSVTDAAAVLEVMAGADANDPTSLDVPVPECSAALNRGVRGVRIGVDEHFMGEYVHPDVVAALMAALEALQRQGAELVRVAIPAVDEVLETWPVICGAEAVAAHEATYPARGRVRTELPIVPRVRNPHQRSGVRQGAPVACRFRAAFSAGV